MTNPLTMKLLFDKYSKVTITIISHLIKEQSLSIICIDLCDTITKSDTIINNQQAKLLQLQCQNSSSSEGKL
jgi:regulator of RNase E activity RraB